MTLSKKITSIGCGLLISLTANLCDAKTITMYEQPAANAKSIGALDSESGIITIFTPKNSEWTKVADPRNGNVGWIKNSDMGNAGFNFNVITKDSGNHKYQIYQYGNMPAQSPAQIENEIKSMELRHQAIQHDMQHMMNDMFSMFYYPQPVFVPVILVPEQHSAKSATSTKVKKAEPMQTNSEGAKDNVKH